MLRNQKIADKIFRFIHKPLTTIRADISTASWHLGWLDKFGKVGRSGKHVACFVAKLSIMRIESGILKRFSDSDHNAFDISLKITLLKEVAVFLQIDNNIV